MSMVKICPKRGAIAEWDSYFGGTRCTRCDFVEKPRPTNADCIRDMSDEELADWLADVTASCHHCTTHGGCIQKWLSWLKKEADNG